MSQQYSAQLKKEAEALQATRRSSQVRVGRAIRNKLVPLLSKRLEQLHNGAPQPQWQASLSDQADVQAIGNDYDVVAHISITIILDSIGRGAAVHTLTKVCSRSVNVSEQPSSVMWKRTILRVGAVSTAGFSKRRKRAT